MEHKPFNVDRILAGCAIGAGLASLVAGVLTPEEKLLAQFETGSWVLFWGGGILLLIGVAFALVRD